MNPIEQVEFRKLEVLISFDDLLEGGLFDNRFIGQRSEVYRAVRLPQVVEGCNPVVKETNR
jgi:hypothetical protein